MAIFDSKELHESKVSIEGATDPTVEFEMAGGIAYTAKFATDLYAFGKQGNKVRHLGHWLAIERSYDVKATTSIEITGGQSIPLDFSGGNTYSLVLDNVCAESPTPPTTDFDRYYKSNGGIVKVETQHQIKLNMVLSKIATHRIACNVALLSKSPYS